MALIIDSNPPVFSRKQLLLRTFFGWAYIILPHVFMLLVALPRVLQAYFSAMIQVGGGQKVGEKNQVVLNQFINWLGNLHLSVYNLQDGYPSYDLNEQQVIYVSSQKGANWSAILMLPMLLVFLLLYTILATPFILFLTATSFFTVLTTQKTPSIIYKLQLGHLDNILTITSRILLVH